MVLQPVSLSSAKRIWLGWALSSTLHKYSAEDVKDWANTPEMLPHTFGIAGVWATLIWTAQPGLEGFLKLSTCEGKSHKMATKVVVTNWVVQVPSIKAAAAGSILGMLTWWLQRIKRHFYFLDYCHATR